MTLIRTLKILKIHHHTGGLEKNSVKINTDEHIHHHTGGLEKSLNFQNDDF